MELTNTLLFSGLKTPSSKFAGMFLISYIFRKSRSAKRPDKAGMFCLTLTEKIVNHDGTELSKTVNIITGIKSLDGEITANIRQQLNRLIRLTYCIIENLDTKGHIFSRIDVMKQLRLALNNDSSMERIIKRADTDFPLKSNLVSLGNEFKRDFQFDYSLDPQQTMVDSDTIDSDTIGGFLMQKSRQFKNEGKQSSARSYASTFSSLEKFCKGNNIKISQIDKQFLHQYSQWLIESGVAESTQSFYLRTLRAAINHAVKEKKLTLDKNLFVNINTKVNYPKKNSFGINEPSLKLMREIACLDLHHDTELELIRDMFMFGFYCHGLEFVDVLNLKKSNTAGNLLRYNRRKSGILREVELTKASSDIIQKYNTASLDYIFPLLEKYKGRSYYTISERVRTLMKYIGGKINYNNLTFGSNITAWNQIVDKLNASDILMIRTG